MDNNILRGDTAVDVLRWSEERKEELELALGKKLAEEWGRGSGGIGASISNNLARGNDDMLLRSVSELLVVEREMLVLLKIGVAMLCFIAVVLVVFLLKK